MKQSSKNRIILGITGNSGSGKTTVSKFIADSGGYIINADKIAHQVMTKGQTAYKKIVSVFGTEIINSADSNPPGEINRKMLGAIVFNNTKKRELLEAIVHPIVAEEIVKQIKSTAAPLIVIDAVLLIESGLNSICNLVWLVSANEQERKSRIISRDNLSQDRAEARMKNQRDTQPATEIANVIINNNGDLKTLESQVILELRKIGL